MSTEGDAQAWTVTVTREGRVWRVEVPDLALVTRAPAMSGAERVGRELIAAAQGVAAAEVAVRVVPVLDEVSAARLADADALGAQGAELTERAARMRAQVIRDLVDGQGLTRRDAAALLGVSPARVQQILTSKGERG